MAVNTYMVERYLPGMSADAMLDGAARVQGAAARMAAQGTPVRYLGSTVIPEEEACFCRFEAPSIQAVEEANERAGFPFARIVVAVAVSAETVGGRGANDDQAD